MIRGARASRRLRGRGHFVAASAVWSLSVLALLGVTPLAGQDAGSQENETDWEVNALPSLNFDSDEGVGYGALAEAYLHDQAGEYQPYILTIRPTLRLSTEGRRDFTVLFDTPHLLGERWRLTVFAGSERHTSTPYYGIGNDTQYDEELEREDGPNPGYYRFGRERRQLTFDLQRDIGDTPLRFLLGAGSGRTKIGLTPRGEGTTLLAQEIEASGGPIPKGWTNYLRGGLVWDTRDREVGPQAGAWTEILIKRAVENLGSDHTFTRWTFTDRRYFSIADRLVFANRVLLQGTTGEAPFYELQIVDDSFRFQEGVGGAKTLRGVLKNRLTGKGVFLWNAELRWRASEFSALGRDLTLVVNAFVDSGRVWAKSVDLGDFSDLRHGLGAGLKLGIGENFIGGLDVGRSRESGVGLYTGLGYLF